MSIYLAYDGSINGNWIGRYAIGLAANHPARMLHVISVAGPEAGEESLRAGIARIETECRRAGVDPRTAILAGADDVFAALLDQIPEGDDSFVVCGARIRSRGRGYLAGTVSERLLRHRRFNVLALRVVQPGLLGNPRDLLLPLSRDPAGARLALPFLRLFRPALRRLHLLRVMTVGHFAFRRIGADRISALREQGWAFLQLMEAELAEALALEDHVIDASVSVSDDWAREVVVHASRLKSGIIYMEAPKPSLETRFPFGDPLEEILRGTPCDVAVYRGIDQP